MTAGRAFPNSLILAMFLGLVAGVPAGPAGAVPDGNYLSQEGEDNDASYHFQQGKAFTESGLWGPAERELQAVLDIVPDDPMAHYYLGLVKIGQDKTGDARAHFAKAVEADGGMYLARQQLGLLALKAGDRATAEAQRDALAAMVEDCGAACATELTTAYESLDGALSGAGAGETGALFLDGRDGAVAYQLAVAEINQNRFAEAIALLKETARDIGPHPDVLNYLGYAHRKLGRFEEAIRYYHQALAINPDHKGATEYLGELYVEIGDLERAHVQLAKLDRLCPFACYEREELNRWIDLASAE